MIPKVFNLKITLWTLYDAHSIPIQQINNSRSQKDETEAKSSIIHIWQILISLKGETPFVHWRNEV